MTDYFEIAVKELYSLIDYEKLTNPGPYGTTESHLEQFRRVLEDRGNPQFQYPTIHIAGSKGKGSTAAVCESILRSSGYKTGLYTSPHLVDIRERIKIDGKAISKEVFASKILEMTAYAKKIGLQKGYRTVFEILTASAFEIFAEAGIEAAVIECGLGGKLDATNVLRPAVTVITPVGLDHTDILGKTIKEIASDKADIMRPGIPVVLGIQNETASKILNEFAEARGAKLFGEIGKNADVENIRSTKAGTAFGLRFGEKKYSDLKTPLLGKFQAYNSATAVVTIVAFRNTGLKISEEAIREGLAKVSWPGRMHLFKTSPEILVDGAHSPMAVEALLDSVREIWPNRPIITVFGANRDKDIHGMINPLAEFSKALALTRFNWPRSAETGYIEGMIEDPKISVGRTETLPEALGWAKKEAAGDDLIIITGSLYIAGEALKLLGYSID
ncbi:MAG: bifunctional folylpolyglutamate synthase/dihydrofolate synthase [bacterium]